MRRIVAGRCHRAGGARAAALLAALAALAGSAPVRAAEGEWLAGDLHVHTTYSHDSYGGPGDDNTGPEDAYTWGWSVGEQFQHAATRGLDFLAITDHNDVRSQADPGFGTGGVLPLPAYENSLKGHAQMLGATTIYDNGDKSPAAVRKVADALRADGGLFQVNHPAAGSTDFPHDADWSYLYAVRPDSVEVWNVARIWQPPAPSANSNDDALRYWEGWLDRGAEVAATGGSDSHWRSTFAAQGVGQPTTWVFARERTAKGVLEGIRLGRTFISHQPPNAEGPRLWLEGAAGASSGATAGAGTARGSAAPAAKPVMLGDEVRPETPLRVHVEGGAGTLVRLVATGSKPYGEPVPVTGAVFEHELKAPAEVGWVRAELFDPDVAEQRKGACDEQLGSETTYCRSMLGLTALTSAIYVRLPEPPAVAPPKGRARLRVARGCVRRTLRAHVRGRSIRRVTFYVDGRRRGVARRAHGGRWRLRANVRRLSPGRHRVRAKVAFRGRRAPRVVRRSFRVCPPR